jgi:hypothetical protein
MNVVGRTFKMGYRVGNVTIDGLVLSRDNSGDGNNRVWYNIGSSYDNPHVRDLRQKIKLPNQRVMSRLARKFLKCHYEEKDRSNCPALHFILDGGLKHEDLAAFLGAVVSHTTIT